MQIKQALHQAQQEILEALHEPDCAASDAFLLFNHATHLTKIQLITDGTRELDPQLYADFRALVEKRKQGVPVAYLLGHQAFWDLDLKVNAATLIPRADTELLVETALSLIEQQQAKTVLDLGTGTGAIILSLKYSAPHISATAVDFSKEALAVAEENAHDNKLEVEFCHGSWYSPLEGRRFDMIVSNPPYIREDDHHLHEGDLRFEPVTALAAPENGLKDLAHIIAHAQEHLNGGGSLLVEHGYDQGADVRSLFAHAGFAEIQTICDYGGNDRVTLGRFQQ